MRLKELKERLQTHINEGGELLFISPSVDGTLTANIYIRGWYTNTTIFSHN